MLRTCGEVRSGMVVSTWIPARPSASTLLGLLVSKRTERTPRMPRQSAAAAYERASGGNPRRQLASTVSSPSS